MTIITVPPKIHWNYFLALERDVDVLSRYIEFTDDNFECYSIELVRILLGAGSETDVICKEICKSINPTSRAKNIDNYRNEILLSYSNIPDIEVIIPRFGLSLHPWDEWHDVNRGVPFWWTAYNKVKHQRNSDYKRANLRNVLNSVAGLFIIVLYHYITEAESGGLSPSPIMFRLHERHTRPIDVIETVPCYKLK